ncbi:hypothetical protein D3C79_911630 [compost metagenome]
MIVRHIVGHNTVHALLTQHVAERRLKCFIHQALPLPFFSQRIAKETGIKRTAQHVAEVSHAPHFIFFRIEQDKIVRAALLLHFSDHPKPRLPAGRVTMAFIPHRLPGFQESPVLGIVFRQTIGIAFMD